MRISPVYILELIFTAFASIVGSDDIVLIKPITGIW